MKKGHTQIDHNEKEDHWYYIGDWYFYNEMRQLDSIKTYKKEEYKNSYYPSEGFIRNPLLQDRPR